MESHTRTNSTRQYPNIIFFFRAQHLRVTHSQEDPSDTAATTFVDENATYYIIYNNTILNLLLEYEKKGHIIPSTLKQHAKELEKSYLDSRYPEVSLALGPKDKYDKKSTTEARDKAKNILDFVSHGSF
nr:HEPN domain-containing protein [Candidatus Sigynarchaeum springense]